MSKLSKNNSGKYPKWQKDFNFKERRIIKLYQLENQIEEALERKIKNKDNQQGKIQLKNELRVLFATKFEVDSAQTHTFPTIINQNNQNTTEHEATTGQISVEINQYLQSRGLDFEQAKNLIVSGFCSDILELLPMEFAIETRRLIQLTLDNGFG